MLLFALMLAASDPPPRPMTVEMVRDPITDAVRAHAIVREDGNRLMVTCDPAEHDGPRISIHSRRWFGRGHILSGNRPLIYRFDNQRPVRMMWDIKDRRATLSRAGRVAAFLRDLESAQRLVIRARDMENRRFDMIFRLKDVAPALGQALAACAADSA
jgi:hypothetical protein